MSQSWALGKAKKISVIIEDEEGHTFQLNFGGDGRSLPYESVMNTEFQTAGLGSLSVAAMYPTRREFNLKIHG